MDRSCSYTDAEPAALVCDRSFDRNSRLAVVAAIGFVAVACLGAQTAPQSRGGTPEAVLARLVME